MSGDDERMLAEMPAGGVAAVRFVLFWMYSAAALATLARQ